VLNVEGHSDDNESEIEDDEKMRQLAIKKLFAANKN